MSDSLNLEESALLVKLKSELKRTKNRVEELAEKVEGEEPSPIEEDIYSLIDQNAKITNVSVGEDAIVFDLSDDRSISVPIWWSWRLEEADKEERQNCMISDDKNKVVWPDVGEEISVTGILTGDPAPRPDEKE